MKCYGSQGKDQSHESHTRYRESCVWVAGAEPNQGAGKKETSENNEKNHKVTSQGFRRRGPVCPEDQPVRLQTV